MCALPDLLSFYGPCVTSPARLMGHNHNVTKGLENLYGSLLCALPGCELGADAAASQLRVIDAEDGGVIRREPTGGAIIISRRRKRHRSKVTKLQNIFENTSSAAA